MGRLKSGTTLIYEKADGVTYAREFGADPSTREEVGRDWDTDGRTSDGRPLIDHLRESKMWGQIHRAALTNPSLKDALDQAVVIYQLSKLVP